MRKLLWLAGFALAFVIPVMAQEVSLKVTNDDVNTIGKALSKLPFDEVAPLIQKLRTQIVEQQQPVPVPQPTPVPKPKE